jgi:hypothetical protein
MVTSELGRWSRTAENIAELLTSIISVNYNTAMQIWGATVIMVSKGNGNVLMGGEPSTTKCPYTFSGLDKFHVGTNYSFKVKRISYSNFNLVIWLYCIL